MLYLGAEAASAAIARVEALGRARDLSGAAPAIRAMGDGIVAAGRGTASLSLGTGEGTSVAFRSAKEGCFRGAKGDNPTLVDSRVLGPTHSG